MVTDPLAQWAFTAVFVLLALYSAVRIYVDRARKLQSIGNALHLAMALDMAAMSWSWWMGIPVIPQVVFFAAGATWFAMIALLQARRVIARRVLGGHGAWHQVAHVVMMLAMIWMVVAMDAPAGGDVGSGAHQHGGIAGWSAVVGVAGTAALVIAGVILFVEFIDCLRGAKHTWLGHTGDVGTGTVMCLGMAAMCWLMLAH